jgi:hypothetical protein
MKIEIEVSDKVEGTRSPYWLIIDPRQNMNKNTDGVYNIAGMITGLFFSREEAEDYLKRTRYNFSKKFSTFSGNL